MALYTYLAMGFDATEYDRRIRRYRVRCSQCQMMAINGIPTHEAGCPNAKHECKGCNTLIPARAKYCEECQ